MKELFIFVSICLLSNLGAMDLETARNQSTESFSIGSNISVERGAPSILTQAPEETAQRLGSPVYYPKHYDATGFLEKEFGCCFCMAKCVLQPLSVLAPLASSLLIGFGEWYIASSPKNCGVIKRTRFRYIYYWFCHERIND